MTNVRKFTIRNAYGNPLYARILPNLLIFLYRTYNLQPYSKATRIKVSIYFMLLSAIRSPFLYVCSEYHLTNKNSIHQEIKCRLKAANPCYYSVQTLLTSRFPSMNLIIKIYRTIMLPVVLCCILD